MVILASLTIAGLLLSNAPTEFDNKTLISLSVSNLPFKTSKD